MARRSCDGAGLLGAFRAAAAGLEAAVDEVNALNVFPVPDGDTGSNMMATVRAALAEAEALGPTVSAERVASAAAFGALMGARGNSGVITSQILRGIAEGLAGKTKFNALDLANALDQGTKAAYGAVAKPVEGTILTVIREASAAAVASAEKERTLEAVMTTTVSAAHAAVAKTPSLLPILREAGVVDSGGQGLFRMMEAAAAYLSGDLVVPAPRMAAAAQVAAAGHGAGAGGHTPSEAHHGAPPGAGLRDEGFGFETMFLARALGGKTLDVDGIRAYYESIGESVLVAGDKHAIKVHIHNERPDLVLQYALGLGTLSKITIENLDTQAADVRETRAAAFTGEGAAPVAASGATNGVSSNVSNGASGMNGTPHAAEPASAEALPLAVVAVAAGEGLAAIFKDFGVHRVVYGGQTANPSTGELLDAVKAVNAEQILLLPNNPNIVLAARQVSAMTDRPVAVVATRNAAEGFAALLALDPDKSALDNATEMTAAGRAIQSLSVTEAVRDATIGGRKVKLGQTIALDPDDGLVAVHDDPATAVLDAIKSLSPGFELLTVYYGDGADLATTEALARRIHDLGTGAEVEVLHGGQPHYRYLISAE
ncbi:MAG TPA: DAK2 domain-containing protein [Candidatus Limnocylindrales bacterium]|nr:DAK2 domain-containing protein [Candidatus Limnocylindrales bacterium]